jgi:alanine racemase
MRIATLGVGYADGYQRHLTAAEADVLLHGQRCRVLGRVTMDQILVDVSHVAEAQEGDEAVLLGRQGEEEIPAAELATKAGTIPWEIFTGIGRRVERVPLHLQSAR